MSIRKRDSKKAKNGFVYEVYFNYTNSEGIPSRYSKSGFATKKEAQLHETEKKQELNTKGEIKKEVKKTLNEVFNEFLEVGCSKYSYNTIYNTKKDFKYLKEKFGNTPIKSIDYFMLQKFFNERSNKGIETNKNIKKVIVRIFNYAFKLGYIQTDPTQYIEVKGVRNEKEKAILSYSDFLKMIHSLEETEDFRMRSYSTALKIGYYTGLRVSEVLALEKKDFDFITNTININKKVNYKGVSGIGVIVSDELKTKSSCAIIPMCNSLKYDLLEWFSINPYTIVVCDENGSHIIPESMLNYLRKVGSKNGIKFNFHMLRHTFATILNEKNIDMKTRQELMRHNDITTTLNIYTHSNLDHKKSVVNSIFDTSFYSESVEKVSNLN